MKKWRIEYRSSYTETPLSFWVHKQQDHETWRLATKFDPELPRALPCKGYPLLVVSVFGYELQFASVAEIEHFIDVISQKNLPTTLQLSKKRGENFGPNSHWLSRLPGNLKSWAKRSRIIPVVEAALSDFKDVYA